MKTVKEKIISLFKKDRKMDKSTQIILDYVEGRLNANDFRNILFKDNKLQEKLKRPIFKAYLQRHNYLLFNYFFYDGNFACENWDTISIRYRLDINLCNWLKNEKIIYSEYYM